MWLPLPDLVEVLAAGFASRGVLVRKMAFARATVILSSLVIWFSRKSQSWMVLFRSLLDQFVLSFDRADGLSIFQFDAVRRIDFSAKDFGRWVQWIRDSCFVFNFCKSKIKASRFVSELILLLCRFWVLKRVARSQLLRLFNDGSDNTALLSWFLLRSGLLEYWMRS